MKCCWILFQISAILSASLALSLRVPIEGAVGGVGNDTRSLVSNVSPGSAGQDPSSGPLAHPEESLSLSPSPSPSPPPSPSQSLSPPQSEPAVPDDDNNNATDTHFEWIIPVSHTGCTHHRLEDEPIARAIERMVEWSNRGGRVEGKSYHLEWLGDVTVYLCNCKVNYRDSAPDAEMWELYMRTAINCGRGKSGWIFSKQWEKGYGIDSTALLTHQWYLQHLCPPGCLW
ncbi:hypothetical protein F4811DRAFT_462306 [Daldinia bambusicola]|nr:hypothetical protein F4811DRAFT_462306 [Daldinia bambusicola]